MLMRPHAVHGEDKEGDHKHEAEYNTYALESLTSTMRPATLDDRASRTFNSWNVVRRTTVRVSTPFRFYVNESPSVTASPRCRALLTKLLMNPGNVHRIGVNQSVSDKLPKLPAKKVYASHYAATAHEFPNSRSGGSAHAP